ncbi:hypothetical protein OSCT_1974 [Oscillochloris trichoides DG-6]|uniref:GH16 domain-containing protein n=1 Tax=Oscillochloris trichoides DG-6 TaxID=765420 RepID=E1IF73_9CHLR|nr:hypothetical protein [Oscillochloris trichoides]EFO80172.1 hypothetical protein OSCT_1974 [Oscillochloris trichoides DG-6]
MNTIRDILACHAPWGIYEAGEGRVAASPAGLRMTTRNVTARCYSDAQIHDYRLRGLHLPRRPPLRISLRARFSHPAHTLRGTAGFGLWNYPNLTHPVFPQTLWFFFASPPAAMELALGVPGYGWKAATMDTGRPQALALLPLAPLAVPLMRSYAGYRLLWPGIQRCVGVHEAPIHTSMTEWHDYEIVWGERFSSLLMDGVALLDRVPSPRGPLCFVAWVDNQYLVVTPQGRFGWGLLDAPEEQWLEISDLVIN